MASVWHGDEITSPRRRKRCETTRACRRKQRGWYEGMERPSDAFNHLIAIVVEARVLDSRVHEVKDTTGEDHSTTE
jgi:hypothetical protein